MTIEDMKSRARTTRERGPGPAPPEPARSGDEQPDRAEGEDHQQDDADQRQRPRDARLHARPGGKPHQQVYRRLHRAEHRHAGEIRRDRAPPPRIGVRARRLRKPVSMSLSQRVPGHVVGARGALDHHRAEHERDVGVRGESLDLGDLLAAAPDSDREHEQREDEVRHDDRRLAERAGDRAPRERSDLAAQGGLTRRRRGRARPARRPTLSWSSTPSSCASASSAAPSSERPVFARKTSSSVGAWSSTFATGGPAASSARITSARSSTPGRRRTATPLCAALDSSPKRSRTSLIGGPVGAVQGDDLDGWPADLRLQRCRACPRPRSRRGR